MRKVLFALGIGFFVAFGCYAFLAIASKVSKCVIAFCQERDCTIGFLSAAALVLSFIIWIVLNMDD